MLKFLSNLINLNAALATRIRSSQAFDEALAFYDAEDYKAALPLMREASELGNPRAMSLLGTMYLMGQGVREDGVQAERWLKQAIAEGFDDATSVLGMAYATGKAGVKIDLDKAIPMLTEAADNGDEQSARMLGMIERGEGMFKKLKRAKRSR
jgi:hypothetical protein